LPCMDGLTHKEVMMTEKLTRLEINAQTGEEIEYELTAEEIAQLEEQKAEAIQQFEAEEVERLAKIALKESAKQKLISGQPLTPEEAATIVI